MDTYSYAEIKKRIRRFREREAVWLRGPEQGSDAALRDLFYSDSAADMALFASPGRPGKRIRKAHRERLVQARQDLRQGREIPDEREGEMLAELMAEMIRLRQKKRKISKVPRLEDRVNLREEIRSLLSGAAPILHTGRIAISNPEKLLELSGAGLRREITALQDTVPAFRSFVLSQSLSGLHGFRRFGRFLILRTETDETDGELIFLCRGDRFAVIADAQVSLESLRTRLSEEGYALVPEKEYAEKYDFLCLTLTPHGARRLQTSRDYLRDVSRELDRITRHCWGKNVACLIERLDQKRQALLEEGRPFLIREDYREIERMFTGKAYCFLLRLHPKKSKNWIEKKYYSRDVNSSGKCLTDPTSGSRLRPFQKLCSSHMGAVCRESDTYGSMAGSSGF